MHGIRRTRQSREDIEARKIKEQKKIKEYLHLTEDLLTRKKNMDWSEEALKLTTKLLQINPEFYTIWNYRRTILVKGYFADCSPETKFSMLSSDLSMTMTALKAYPKVYWIWNHRRWCLENVPDGPAAEGEDDFGKWKKQCWDNELYVVEKMLDADARNFHAWDYRRYILTNMPNPKSEESELAYTTRKIEANFSNFSAWHQRSKVLGSMWAAGKLDEGKSKEEEFEIIHNAMYTEPRDQSVWIYHRWLIGAGKNQSLLEREITIIQELLDEQPDSKWCMESLVHYKQMLIEEFATSVDVATLSRDCVVLLKELVRQDPTRRRRYEDLGKRIDSLL